jgi:hypothetical protein
MGGDEITADWLGDINSFYITTSATVTRFSGAALRYRDVHINNPSASNSAWIGWYNSNATTFMDWAVVINPEAYLKFKYIDLHELGFYRYGGTNTVLKVLCINEY